MHKALFAGAIGLAVGSGLVVPHVASAYYNQTSCARYAGSTTATVPGSGSVTVNGGDNQVACADGFGSTTFAAFEGGALSVRTGGSSNPGRNCNAVGEYERRPASGRYVVFDGDSGNHAANLSGYIGYSDYESSETQGCHDPWMPGSGTNSGGSFGLDVLPTTRLPLPIACGYSSGDNYADTERDGCSLP